MRTICKILLPILIICINYLTVSAQQNYWHLKTDTSGIITDKAVARQSFPKVFKLFNLDINSLRQELFTITDNRVSHSTIISLPNADGNFEQFEVFEASNFEPALQSRFPQIRAFSGKGITDKAATLKMSIAPGGIQTMIFRTDQANEFIEAFSQDHTVYAVFKSFRESGKLAWTCTTEDKKIFSDISSDISYVYQVESNTGELKTMRLAQSCNGEYSNYFGAFNSSQVALVLAAFNATLTRCNGVYEKDLAVHLNLISNTTSVIYYDPATDPYTTLSNWNLQLQQTLTAVIGNANYDIGHMFGASGGGGNAGCIGCVCVDPVNNNSKAKGSGITSPADGIPQGDNFDIDYVVHEVGHQLGANHTFSHSLEGTGVNKEVGSGITIMGYAGITNYDAAPHSIDIFHQASIAQIQANLATKSCPVTTNITANNATPVVSPVSNYTIPISTPFALTGSATDANPGDVLTYCWEQNDNSTTSGANSVASPTKATGPNWISFSPTTSPTRLLPKLSTILAGLLITPTQGGDPVCNVEALSSVSRTLNFRLTVRDNSAYSSTPPIKVGQTAFTDMVVTVSNSSGPFEVTAPNTAVTWAGGSSQTITWNVNNTTAAPVSCANVKITLSTDGGITFPTVIAASTLNDGTETITVPAASSSTCRIKIEAVGNIFFDISNTNFTITGCTAGTVSGTSPLCISATATYTSNGTPGGSWSSTNTGVATVNSSTGLVSAVTAGTTNITYTVTAGCGSPVSAFKTLTVSPNVTAGTVSGTSPLCISNTATYTSNGTTGGSWSSTNTTVATVNSSTGLVTALSAGTTNITYTVSSGCSSPLSAVKVLTVSNTTSGTVSGTSPLCLGATATYTSNGTTGGTWSSTNTAVATVNSSSGLVTTVSTGTTNITYTVSSGCPSSVSSFKALTVNSTVTAGTVSGTSPLCVGNTDTYTSNGTGGGSWSSTNTSVATVNSSTGLVTAIGPGTTNITYTINSGCGSPISAFKTLTVNPTASAGTVSGTSPLCLGATATYTSNGTSGGTWSSTNSLVAAVNSSTGLVTAVSVGTTNITYTVSGGGCGSPVSAFKTLTTIQCEFIQGSVKRNIDPVKIDIVFKPSYTSILGEYCLFLQFAVSLPLAASTGITATATGVNTFSNMGVLSALIEFTETFGTPTAADDERVFGFAFPNPTASTQSWTNGIDFTGVEVTFSSSVAASNVKMLDLENAAGGDNGNTYFVINTNTGDKRNNGGLLFFPIPGSSHLGTYPNSDQFVQTTGTPLVNDNAPGAILLSLGSGCSGSPYTNVNASQSVGEPFAACKGNAGFKTVWFKFIAPASGNIRISNDYSGGTMGSDSRLALFSATDVNNYATFINLACDDDNGVILVDRSILYITGLTSGNTYYIQVDGKDVSTASGSFCLTVDEMTSAMLSTATACASGQPLTSVNDNYTGWQSIADASGKLIALINNPAGGATTSTYTSGQNINAGPVRTDPISSQRYLDRNYLINNATVSNVNVQFFFLSPELTTLQAVDPLVTLANLQVTRQTGTTCDNNFVAANGTNTSLTQTSTGSGTGFSWIQVSTPGFSKFFLHTIKSFVPVKTFLHGAYNAGLARHKDVNTTWAAIMNANALSQPYNVTPFNYTGTETVSSGFFTSTPGVQTDAVDWVLLELRDAVTPATVIARRAAFIREDGRVVDLDGVSDVSFRTVANSSYHLVIAHRNHLAIRTATVRVVNGTLGFTALLYDFSTAQSQAYQNIAITANSAQRDLTGGVFGLWGGNADGNTSTRVTGLANNNDYLFLLSVLGNNPANIFNNMYNKADVNMDGTIRSTGLASINDYLFLLSALDNNPSKIVSQHQ